MEEAHAQARMEMEELRALCTDPRAAKLATKLGEVYNRAITSNLTKAEQHTSDAVYGGRSAVAAYENSHDEMAASMEQRAINVDDFDILDGMIV